MTATEILTVTRDHLSLRPGLVWIDVEEVMRATTDQPASLSLLLATMPASFTATLTSADGATSEFSQPVALSE